jgi:hypothetical protein
VDFKNTLIIMTSNVGASVIEKGGRNFGFFLRPDDEDQEQDASYSRIKTLVGEELKNYFRWARGLGLGDCCRGPGGLLLGAGAGTAVGLLPQAARLGAAWHTPVLQS